MRVYTALVALLILACSGTENVIPSEGVSWKYFEKKDGLVNNLVWSLFEDSKGNLWIGTNGGVSQYDGQVFTSYTTANGLTSNVVNAITETVAGDMLFGTNNGLSILKNGNWLYVPAFSNVSIFALARDADNRIWIGTYQYGILQYNYEGGSFKQVLDNTCAACNNINTIFVDKDRQVWVGSEANVRMFTGTAVQTFTDKSGIAGKYITSISQDSWGSIWLGSKDNVNVTRYYGGMFEQVSLSNGASSSNWVRAIQEDNVGQLWFGLVAWGLVQYDGVVMHKQYEGVPDDTITCMIKDRNGNIWVGTYSAGIGKFVPKRR